MAGTLSLAALLTLGVAEPGCADDPRDLFSRTVAPDAGTADPRSKPPKVDPTLGGPCTEDSQCNDALACTFDSCDRELRRCRTIPDDSLCADSSFCNGRETCVLRVGCTASAVVTCQDDDSCTLDRCVESTKACEHAPRDVDGDGDPDDHCVRKRDCDDLDPNVGSQRAEICGNLRDDNCNGLVDEAGCVQPANDVCATALAISASGTYALSTRATKKDYGATCSVATPSSAKDVVVAMRVPGGVGDPARDVEVWVTADVATNEVAVALQRTCGDAASELGCGHVDRSPSARTIARAVQPGTVLYAVVTTQTEGFATVNVDFRASSPKSSNEGCAAPEAVALDAPTVVRLVDAERDLETDCEKAKTGELAYSFMLAEPRDVRIFASTLVGAGVPVVTLRDADCTREVRCTESPSRPLFARGLDAGRHVFSVAATQPIDASVLVTAYPPTAAPANQSCTTAPAIEPNTTLAVDLSGHEAALKSGCFAGGLAAAYALTLARASDVLLIGRFPANESGSLALHGPSCAPGGVLGDGCAVGVSPQRVSGRSVPAGDYRVVVADELGQTAQLSVLARDAVPPTTVGASDTCAAAFVLPAAGGFFTGDTSNAAADYSAGCDAPGQPLSGAKDQILRLDLAASRRVVMDMTGSAFTTVLDVRKGAVCGSAIEVPGACFVGKGSGKSFLDLTLGAGTYWLQIDGYAGEFGPWSLDVRVLPP